MKTTLVAVSGMSPAIITETLWALASESPSIVPDDVIVITTSKGELDIRDMLLKKSEAWDGGTVWERLRSDISTSTKQSSGSGKLQLSVRVIELPDDLTGIRRPADDLRTRSENDSAADFIVQTLAPLCDAEDNHVIASIAGGRKTMGALLYAAMSLLGKESDRVTHVLVGEPFESVRGFFYPSQPVQELEARPFGQSAFMVCASDAKVDMADLPFVPLRNKFSELKEPRRTFAGLVKAYSNIERAVLTTPPVVTIDEEKGILSVEGRSVHLTGRDLLITAFLLRRARAGKSHYADKDGAVADLAAFMVDWKRDYPFHKAQARLSGKVATIDDIPKALNALRKNLEAKKLAGAIPYLAPERRRIGFEIDQATE